jgi:hypothetical protein
MRNTFALALGLMLALPASRAHADVRVTMKDGLVTLTATSATVREILAEWAKVGQTRIVNAERIAGTPLTIQLTEVPEAQALDIVLRSVSGYVAAPRTEISPGLSRYDRILVLPTSTPPRNVPAPTPPPSFQPPAFPLPGPDPDLDDERQNVPAMTPGRGGVFSPFPQGPSPNDPPPPPVPAPPVFGTPGVRPMGVTVPGMVVPAPVPSGQIPPTRPPDQDQR